MLLIKIFSNVITAIFVITGVGFILDKAFKLDIPTLSKLNFYVFAPVVVLSQLVNTDLATPQLAKIGAFTLVHHSIIFLTSWALFSLKPFVDKRTVLSWGSTLYNAGNYGFPLMLLAFGKEGVTVIATVLIVQIILFYTVGIMLFQGRGASTGKSLLRILTYPAIYAVVLGLIMRATHVTLPAQLQVPLGHLYNGFISINLLTLGAQLARSKIDRNILPVAGVSLMRLVMSPLLAFVLVPLFGFGQDIGPVLTLGAGLPVAVNVFIFASEFKRDPDFASQMVFWTTLISAGTISIIWLLLS